MTRRAWTRAEIALVKARYPDTPTAQIAAELGRPVGQVYSKAERLGIKKSSAYMAGPHARRLRRGGAVGASSRFQAGHKTWNKGMKGLQLSDGRGQFKPGTVPPNRKPVGTIRKNTDGYLDVKVAPGKNKWVALHRWNWKLAHGEYPPAGMALVFKDGNRLNCDIGNLELIDRRELMNRNTVHNYPIEVVETVRLKAVLTRKINQIVEKKK